MSCVIKPSAWNWDGEYGATLAPYCISLRTSILKTSIRPKLSALQTMPPIPAARSTLLRLCPRQHLPATIVPSIAAATQQRRCKADVLERHSGEVEQTPRFDSPFKNRHENPTTKIPSFANYMSKRGQMTNRTFQYFMVGTMGLLTAAGAKATVQGKHSELAGGTIGRRFGVLWENMGTQWLTTVLECRFPGQHGRLRGCARASQGRARLGCRT